MADPPSLFPEYMEQTAPGLTNLVDNIIVVVDLGVEVVIETDE